MSYGLRAPIVHRESLFVLLLRVTSSRSGSNRPQEGHEESAGARWHEGVVGGAGIRRSTSLDLARRLRPDLPVPDVMMPHLSGFGRLDRVAVAHEVGAHHVDVVRFLVRDLGP